MNHNAKAPLVLIVDDNREVSGSLAELISDLEMVAVVASTGNEALACLKSCHRFSVMIADINMPGSLDGLQLSEVAHALFPALAIILMSGTCEPPEQMPNHLRFLPKPFSSAQIAALLKASNKPR